MSISQEILQRNLDFLGYGTLTAPIWFLGMEEAFRGNYQHNLEVRAKFDSVMDVKDAHELLESRYWQTQRLHVSSVWKWMAKFTRALVDNADDWESVHHANEYIRSKLGRDAERGGETFLLELLPLPKRSKSDWPPEYRLLFPNVNEYRNNTSKQRIELIHSLLDTYTPHYLFCYGQANYSYYRSILGPTGWEPLSGTKFELNKYHSTTVVLTPFFGNARLSKYDAHKLVDFLKGGSI